MSQAEGAFAIKAGATLINEADFTGTLRRLDLHRFRGITDEVMGYHLVLQACERMGIDTSVDELQEGADNLRRANGLASASDTEAWMRASHLSVDDLEQHVRFWILARRLLTHTYGANVIEDRFQSGADHFTKAALSVITVDKQETAADICAQIRGGTATFQDLAREHSLDARTGPAGGMVGWVTLDSIPQELRGPVAASDGGGELLGPIEANEKWHVVEVAATTAPERTPVVDMEIMRTLLAEWSDSQAGDSIEEQSAN